MTGSWKIELKENEDETKLPRRKQLKKKEAKIHYIDYMEKKKTRTSQALIRGRLDLFCLCKMACVRRTTFDLAAPFLNG